MAVKYKASTTHTSSSGQTHGGTSGKFGTPTTTNAMNYNTGPYAAPTTSAMNYTSGAFAAPKTKKTTTTPKVAAVAPQRDIASEIAAEMSKGTIDWTRVGQLSAERDTKIKSSGIQTQSTSDYINQLYANRNSTPQPDVQKGNTGMEYNRPDQYPVAPPPVQETYYMQPDYTKQLIDLVQNQFKYNATSDINALRQAYEQGRGQLQGQLPGIDQNARSAYDANDAGYNQSLNELRAAMEQAGLYRGGDMLGGNVNLLTMRGQNAGNISQDKMNQVNAIQQAIAQLNAEEPLKIAEVEASNNAAEAQALLNAVNMGMQNQLAVGELTGNIMGTDTLSKIQQAYSQAMGIADRTGNMPDGSTTLAAQQQAADLAYRQQQFEESVRQFNANYGIDLKRLSLDQVQQELDNKYRMGQLSLQQKNQALNEAEFAYQKEQDLTNYNLTTQQTQQQTTQQAAQAYSGYMQQAIKMLGETSSDKVIAYIRSLPISAELKAQLANDLGL